MNNGKNILIEEEPIICYPSTFSNFGVHSKKIKSPKNLYMSFTPLFSERERSYSNTIMYPIITTEATIDTEKNTSHLENEKSKHSEKKNSTRIKTESSKEDKNNLSYEKQISQILSESNENSKSDSNLNVIEINCNENRHSNEQLEINPFFNGGKSSFDMNKFINKNDNTDIEEKKVNKLLNKEQNNMVNENSDSNLYFNTTKNVNNNANNDSIKKKLNRRTQRLKSLNLTKCQKFLNAEKEQKMLRKSKIKHKTILPMENLLLKQHANIQKKKHLENKFEQKNNFFKSRGNKRELTVCHKTPIIKLKDHNIKIYRANIFNVNNSTKVKSKMTSHLKRVKTIQEKDEEEPNLKKQQNNFIYFVKSDNSLNTKFCIDSPKNKKKEEKNDEKTRVFKFNNEVKRKSTNFDENFNLKGRKLSHSLHQFKRLKTFNKEYDTPDKKKSLFNNKKKVPETSKNLDFELALKNKKNLANTQFNLFSPDKFTNTQFCGSDYCEYTLECMDLILSNNKSQKQVKNKVNFNFPKCPKNKLKKKIALFDLDETLVHCTGDIKLKEEQYQHSIEINLPGNKEVTVGINIRPFWKKTLNLIKKHYHIVVFTASHQAYADAVLDFMDPGKKYFKYRLYRNNCSLVDVDGAKFYVKDLDIFDEYYDLKDIVIIDNSVLSFIYHLENGIPIVPYYNEDKDGSLYVVGLYLMHIYKENDLREANKKYINLDSFLKEARERKDQNSTINEESISVDNNNNNNEQTSNNNVVNEINKLDLNKDTITISEKDIKQCSTNRRNSKGISYQSEKEHRNKLVSQSKLINMYYSLNDKCVSNFETKNKNNLTTDEEKDINENESLKDDSDLFIKKRLLTNQNESKRSKITFKNSNKTCRDYLDLKLVCSNFNHNFFSEKII